MRQQGWHSNSDHQSLVSGLQVKPAVSVFDSQMLLNQARLNGGFGANAMHQDWHSQNSYQNGGIYQKGGMHQSGWGHGSGKGGKKLIGIGTNGFNSSSQFSNASMFDNAMGNAEFETFETVHVPASGTMRIQETRYERRSWGGDDGDLNYNCFDNGGSNRNRNGGYQSFEWFSKGI